MTLRGSAEHFLASIEAGIVGMSLIPTAGRVSLRPACDPDRSTRNIRERIQQEAPDSDG
jgi:hypothetical protein